MMTHLSVTWNAHSITWHHLAPLGMHLVAAPASLLYESPSGHQVDGLPPDAHAGAGWFGAATHPVLRTDFRVVAGFMLFILLYDLNKTFATERYNRLWAKPILTQASGYDRRIMLTSPVRHLECTWHYLAPLGTTCHALGIT